MTSKTASFIYEIEGARYPECVLPFPLLEVIMHRMVLVMMNMYTKFKCLAHQFHIQEWVTKP